MIVCARATRGLRRPSLDARRGRSISPIPGYATSEPGRIICINCSFDLGCASSRDPPLFPFSLLLGWKGCGLRRSTWPLPARVHPFTPHISLRIAAPSSRPLRQFGARSIERLRLAEGEVASMFDVPFMHCMERNEFRCQAAVRLERSN